MTQHDTCPLCRSVSTTRTPRQTEMSAWLEETGCRLNPQQRSTALYAIENHLTVVTGAGGTGKTEVASVLGRFVQEGRFAPQYTRDCVFLGPTGKAAETIRARLGGVCQVSTIHR